MHGRVYTSGTPVLHDRQASEQVIREARARKLAREVELSAAARARFDECLPVRGGDSERDLMVAAHEREVIADLHGMRMRQTVACVRAEAERPCHAHVHPM